MLKDLVKNLDKNVQDFAVSSDNFINDLDKIIGKALVGDFANNKKEFASFTKDEIIKQISDGFNSHLNEFTQHIIKDDKFFHYEYIYSIERTGKKEDTSKKITFGLKLRFIQIPKEVVSSLNSQGAKQGAKNAIYLDEDDIFLICRLLISYLEGGNRDKRETLVSKSGRLLYFKGSIYGYDSETGDLMLATRLSRSGRDEGSCFLFKMSELCPLRVTYQIEYELDNIKSGRPSVKSIIKLAGCSFMEPSELSGQKVTLYTKNGSTVSQANEQSAEANSSCESLELQASKGTIEPKIENKGMFSPVADFLSKGFAVISSQVLLFDFDHWTEDEIFQKFQLVTQNFAKDYSEQDKDQEGGKPEIFYRDWRKENKLPGLNTNSEKSKDFVFGMNVFVARAKIENLHCNEKRDHDNKIDHSLLVWCLRNLLVGKYIFKGVNSENDLLDLKKLNEQILWQSPINPNDKVSFILTEVARWTRKKGIYLKNALSGGQNLDIGVHLSDFFDSCLLSLEYEIEKSKDPSNKFTIVETYLSARDVNSGEIISRLCLTPDIKVPQKIHTAPLKQSDFFSIIHIIAKTIQFFLSEKFVNFNDCDSLTIKNAFYGENKQEFERIFEDTMKDLLQKYVIDPVLTSLLHTSGMIYFVKSQPKNVFKDARTFLTYLTFFENSPDQVQWFVDKANEVKSGCNKDDYARLCTAIIDLFLNEQGIFQEFVDSKFLKRLNETDTVILSEDQLAKLNAAQGDFFFGSVNFSYVKEMGVLKQYFFSDLKKPNLPDAQLMCFSWSMPANHPSCASYLFYSTIDFKEEKLAPIVTVTGQRVATRPVSDKEDFKNERFNNLDSMKLLLPTNIPNFSALDVNLDDDCSPNFNIEPSDVESAVKCGQSCNR